MRDYHYSGGIIMELEPLQDKILICVDCNEEFVFTISAQEYFLKRGIVEEPKRCKSCYTALKKQKRQEKKEIKVKSSSNSRRRTTTSYRHYSSNNARGNLK